LIWGKSQKGGGPKVSKKTFNAGRSLWVKRGRSGGGKKRKKESLEGKENGQFESKVPKPGDAKKNCYRKRGNQEN